MAVNVSAVPVIDASGEEQTLGTFAGQVVLAVNVASRCGFTRQYTGLQALQEAYGPQGFTVLAFPCNDFGAQEPGSLSEIQQFCSTTYGVNFPVFSKVAISAEPFSSLVQAEPAGPVAWNRAGPLQEWCGAGGRRTEGSHRGRSGGLRATRAGINAVGTPCGVPSAASPAAEDSAAAEQPQQGCTQTEHEGGQNQL